MAQWQIRSFLLLVIGAKCFTSALLTFTYLDIYQRSANEVGIIFMAR